MTWFASVPDILLIFALPNIFAGRLLEFVFAWLGISVSVSLAVAIFRFSRRLINRALRRAMITH